MKYKLFSEFMTHTLQESTLKKHEFVRRMGYTNINRGITRLSRWLSGTRLPKKDQINQIADAFKLPVDTVFDAINADIKRLDMMRIEKRKQDPKYYLVIWMMPAVRVKSTLSEGLSEQEAIEYASKKLAEISRKGFLDTPRGITHWFSNTGELYASHSLSAL